MIARKVYKGIPRYRPMGRWRSTAYEECIDCSDFEINERFACEQCDKTLTVRA